MKLFPFILLLLCLTGCKTLDKKIVRMSATQPTFQYTPPSVSCEAYLGAQLKRPLRTMQSKAQPEVAIQPGPISRATTNLNLSWTANDTNATGYNLYCGFAAGEYSETMTLGNVTNVTAALASGYAWHFSVTAIDENPIDESDFSAETAFTPALILELHFPNPGILQSSTDLVNWEERDAAFDGNVYRVSDPKWPKEFYRTTTTK